MSVATRLVVSVLLMLAGREVLAFTAEELVAKNLAAKGGLENLRAIHSLRLEGKMLVNGDALELSVVTLVKSPDAIRYEAELQGLIQVQACDAGQAWQINPFQGRKDPEMLSADDAKGMGEDAADFLGALVDYQAKGYRLEYLGSEDIEGSPALKLRVSRKNGDTTFVYLDPDQFLEVRTVNRRIEHGVPHETINDYGDYEKVGGVYVALAIDSWTKGTTDHQKVQYDKAQANVALDDGVFRYPAPVPRAAATTAK